MQIEGKIRSARGPVIEVEFKDIQSVPKVYEVIQSESASGKMVMLEVMEQLGEGVVKCIALTSCQGLRRNSPAIRKGSIISMPEGKACYGRLMNAFGIATDQKGEIKSEKQCPTKKTEEKNLVEVDVSRERKYKIMISGIKMIDLLFPLVVGSKTGIIGGAALGKSILTLEIIHNVVRKIRASCVFTGAGERIREGNELYHELKSRGILDKVALVFGQMNESPGARYEVVFSGITVAESMQEMGEDVLFFVDNIYRFAQAGAELSTLMGRIPSETGYQPTLISEISEFHERIRSQAAASITSIEAVYVPADDLTDPAVVTIFSHLDATVVLSRDYVQKGLYPAIDPVLSFSSFLDPRIIGERHLRIAQEARSLFQKYEELQKLVVVIGEEELSRSERTLYMRAQKLQNFLTQPFFVAEDYTGKKGQFVTLEETLDGCDRIMSGRVDGVNKEKFYMIGALPVKM